MISKKKEDIDLVKEAVTEYSILDIELPKGDIRTNSEVSGFTYVGTGKSLLTVFRLGNLNSGLALQIFDYTKQMSDYLYNVDPEDLGDEGEGQMNDPHADPLHENDDGDAPLE